MALGNRGKMPALAIFSDTLICQVLAAAHFYQNCFPASVNCFKCWCACYGYDIRGDHNDCNQKVAEKIEGVSVSSDSHYPFHHDNKLIQLSFYSGKPFP